LRVAALQRFFALDFQCFLAVFSPPFLSAMLPRSTDFFTIVAARVLSFLSAVSDNFRGCAVWTTGYSFEVEKTPRGRLIASPEQTTTTLTK